jgi:hypothetical protein
MAVKGTESGSQDLMVGYLPMKIKKVEFKAGDNKNIISVLLHEPNKKFFAKADFFVSSNINKSSKVDEQGNSKTQFIDKYSNTQWKVTPEDQEYNGNLTFEAKSARECCIGEEAFMNFIKNYMNPKKGDECRFDDFKKIAEGDLTEVNEAITVYPNNNVGVLLGVRDAKYQGVYTGKFERGFAKEPKQIIKAVKGDTYNKLVFGQEPYPFKKFDPTEAPQPDSEIPSGEAEIHYTNSLADMMPAELFPSGDDENVPF